MYPARSMLGFAVAAVLAVAAGAVYSQAGEPINSLPNPYRSITDWAKMPAGRSWGSTAGVGIDRDGSSVWVAERCGAFAPPSSMKPGVPFACDGSSLDPILKFDPSGKLMKAFGAGLFVLPHGLHVDPDGNIWVTDGVGKDGKGHQAIKFSPEGKVLMRLGKAGVAGNGLDEFNAPSAVYVAPDGDIFVADGHGGNTNARIVKFDKNGKFIKTWGKKGSRPLRLRHSPCPRHGFARPPVRRRPQQQPHPDLRPGRQASRFVVAVQPSQRHRHRQERQDLRGRFGIRSRSTRLMAPGSAACASAAPSTAP